MARKVILCRCEDVTLADVQHAVRLGYTDVEEVKRGVHACAFGILWC